MVWHVRQQRQVRASSVSCHISSLSPLDNRESTVSSVLTQCVRYIYVGIARRVSLCNNKSTTTALNARQTGRVRGNVPRPALRIAHTSTSSRRTGHAAIGAETAPPKPAKGEWPPSRVGSAASRDTDPRPHGPGLVSFGVARESFCTEHGLSETTLRSPGGVRVCVTVRTHQIESAPTPDTQGFQQFQHCRVASNCRCYRQPPPAPAHGHAPLRAANSRLGLERVRRTPTN